MGELLNSISGGDRRNFVQNCIFWELEYRTTGAKSRNMRENCNFLELHKIESLQLQMNVWEKLTIFGSYKIVPCATKILEEKCFYWELQNKVPCEAEKFGVESYKFFKINRIRSKWRAQAKAVFEEKK